MARILVVEDEAVTAMELRSRLNRLGFQVGAPARTGEEALDRVRDEAPDLVLMDIRLPGKLDGVTTAHALRTFGDIPVIFLTGYSDSRTVRMAEAELPFGFLLKPIGDADLGIAIEMALARHGKDAGRERLVHGLGGALGRLRDLVENAGRTGPGGRHGG